MSGTTLVPVLAERLPSLVGLKPLGLGPPDPAEMAAFMAFSAPVDGYQPPDVEVVDAVVPGPHGDIPVRIYRAHDSSPTHGLVWCHGGAFMFGDLDMPESDVVARELASRHPVIVVAVDYRLCHGPVHFPIPHDDVYAAFIWATANADLLAPGASWSVGGASAGGNLAAGVAQRMSGEPGPSPAAVVLAYPVLHHDIPEPSPELAARVRSLPDVLTFPQGARAGINQNFLGVHKADEPFAFAALGSLVGFPTTFISMGDHDDLGPSGETFARQLADAGVRCEVEHVVGVPHGHLNIGGLPAALATIEAMAAFMANVGQ